MVAGAMRWKGHGGVRGDSLDGMGPSLTSPGADDNVDDETRRRRESLPTDSRAAATIHATIQARAWGKQGRRRAHELLLSAVVAHGDEAEGAIVKGACCAESCSPGRPRDCVTRHPSAQACARL